MGANRLEANQIDFWRWTVGEVTPQLLVGGDLPPDDAEAIENLEEWLDAGLTDILDVREEWTDKERIADWVDWVGYFHLGTHDEGGPQSDEWFDEGVEIARCVLAEEGAKLLVHCHMGINRGPSMALAILLDQGWDITEALDAIRAARPIAAISYAEDAVGWHVRRTGGSPDEVRYQRHQVARWHRLNGIDVSQVIRRVRHLEDGSAA